MKDNQMQDFILSVQDIKDLIGTLHKNNMGKLKITSGDFSLELEGNCGQISTAAPIPVVHSFDPVAGVVEEGEAELPGSLVTSPIVGTFYAAPAPDKPPYVTAGTKVKKGDILFIIESMKLMNEVTSEYDGTVSKILVENGQPVEYGQPILCME